MRLSISIALCLPFALGAAPPAAAQIATAEHAQRRATVARSLGGGVLLVLAAPEPAKDYLSFHQDPSFDYLAGIREPGAALVVVARGNSAHSVLFVEPRDPAREVWSGHRLGTDGARKLSGMTSRLLRQLPATLDSLLGAGDTLWLAGDRTASGSVEVDSLVAGLTARNSGTVVRDGGRAVLAARAFKSPAELGLLRTAIGITVAAHRDAMRLVRPGLNEFEAQALVEYTFRRNGADRPSFASIIGSGPNATTLHYNANDRFMSAGEMLVMDIGASYLGYAADVTRSVPVSGRFTAEQRAVYTIVRDAQRAAERQATVGAPWRTLSDSARAVIATGLAGLGLVDDPAASYECAPERLCAQVELFYMHGLGHGIGLDVHDPERHEVTGALEVGSVFTLEPGIYVRANLLEIIPDTPANAALRQRLRATLPRYANIGVRIEDDYLLATTGLEWLSRGAPREIDEVEALMREPYSAPSPRDASVVERYRRHAP
ncbi:MAG: aminopeptidase P family protein [Gemmatimonadaceae bacterium]